MESSGIVAALLIALLTLGLGLLIFRSIFDLATLKVRPRFQGLGKRAGLWFRSHARTILLAALILLAVCALGYGGVRLGPKAVEGLRGLALRRGAAAAVPGPSALIQEPAEASPTAPAAIVADHRVVDEVRLDRIPPADLQRAAQSLHILLVHGTHGAQITYGLKGLIDYKGPAYAGLDIEAIEFADRSEPDLAAWVDRARSYLKDPGNRDVNVVMWLWSDELSAASEADVAAYLALTGELEAEFPGVGFVYTTGHLDASGPAGNLRQRNEQIRRFCSENGKILYDFADIESYDPDGNYYGDRAVNDGCWYDSDEDGSLDRNWAKEWSDTNPGAWYDCYSPHTYPLNANLKAYAAWWLWVTVARKEQGNEAH